jgi:hypothetical protein
MAEAGTASLDDLVEEIVTWPVGMPVRPMESRWTRSMPASGSVWTAASH